MQSDQVGRRIFGFQEEWRDFEKRNELFLERFPHIEKALAAAFNRDVALSEPIDKFLLMLGRVCAEDFFEILLCCGNGYGEAAQKLLRGLYERTVTLRYLNGHPAEIDNFLDFHWVAQRKLMYACINTMGKDTFSQEIVAETESQFQAIKERYMVTDCETCNTKRLNHTWSKLDFVAMAKTTELGQLIVPGYYLPLRQAHATLASVSSRMKVDENGGISFTDLAQRKSADSAMRMAHNLLLDVLRAQDERFSIEGLKLQNEVCLQDFMDIWQGRKTTDSSRSES